MCVCVGGGGCVHVGGGCVHVCVCVCMWVGVCACMHGKQCEAI